MIQFCKDNPTPRYQQTIEMLRNRPRKVTFDVIAEATGIENGWLRSFATGRIKGADFNRVEVLYAYLKSLQN